MHPKITTQATRLSLRKACWLVFALLIGTAGSAQEPLSLRQAIQQALKQNPDADLAIASIQRQKRVRRWRERNFCHW
jgi:hypothetical protein